MPQKQSPKRFKQLLQQYPFLEGIFLSEQGVATDGDYELNSSIRIKRGDPDLMFRQADDVLGNGHSIGDLEDRSVVGTRFEHYYPVSRDGRLGKMHSWLNWRGQYVRDLFNRPCDDWEGSFRPIGDDPFEIVSSIVWVTKETWYPEGTDMHHLSILTQPVRRNFWVTLYREPKSGWRELYRTADPLINVNLYGWRLIEGPELRDSFRDVIYDRLNRLGQEFQQKVWETGLGKIIDDSTKKGMSGQYGSVFVMSYVIAGRLRIQFERGGTSLTLGGFDEVDEPHIGFASISGTLPQAEGMVKDVIKFWEKADTKTRRTVHQDNPNVNMGF